MSIKKDKSNGPNYNPKKRKCLATDCGKDFNSTWEGNRICPKCSQKAEFKNGITLFDEPVTVSTKHD